MEDRIVEDFGKAVDDRIRKFLKENLAIAVETGSEDWDMEKIRVTLKLEGEEISDDFSTIYIGK